MPSSSLPVCLAQATISAFEPGSSASSSKTWPTCISLTVLLVLMTGTGQRSFKQSRVRSTLSIGGIVYLPVCTTAYEGSLYALFLSAHIVVTVSEDEQPNYVRILEKKKLCKYCKRCRW